jgi:hypothetical protein
VSRDGEEIWDLRFAQTCSGPISSGIRSRVAGLVVPDVSNVRSAVIVKGQGPQED